MSGAAGDFLAVGADLVKLLKARAIEAAVARVNEQLRHGALQRHQAAAMAIAELNLAIKAAEAERKRVEQALDEVPAAERRRAQLELKPLVDRLFSEEIARLRAEKRRVSRGG